MSSMRSCAASPSPQRQVDDSGVTAALAQLRAADAADRKTIAALEEQLSGTKEELGAAQHSLKVYEAGQYGLQEQLNEKITQIAALESQA